MFLLVSWMFRSEGARDQQTRGVRKTGLHCKGDILTFVGFGTRRFVFICVIAAVRVVIAFSLLYTGILWLLNTTSIEDIVLNAAALGFVIDLDEVLFVTLVAEPAKAILRKMEPLYRLVTPPLRLWGREAGTDFIFPCFAWIGFAVLMGLVMPVITENVETMRDLQHQLCGGNLDFVAQVMPSTDVVLVKGSTPFVSRLPDSFEFDALEELVWSPNVSSALLSLFTDTDFEFTFFTSQDVATFSNWHSLCSDFQFESSLSRKVSDLLAMPDTWRCSDIDQNECWILNNTLLRHQCPSTRGCDYPQSPQAMLSATYGCPEDACRTSDSYRSALDQISCTSPDVEDLQVNANWTQYLDNLVTWSAGFGGNFSYWASLLSSFGCAVAAAPLLQDLFGLGSDLSLARWCPVELGCRAPRTSNAVGVYPGHCPPQCDAWRSNYMETRASRSCVDSSAAELASGSAADFLTFHLNTFTHVFGTWSGDALRSDGCAALATEVCGFPYYLRAVCPETCGCGSNTSLFLCPGSCASSVGTASERNSAPSLGSTSTSSLPSRSTTSRVNSSTATIETTHTTLSPSTTATSIGNNSSTRLEDSSIRHQSATSM